MYVCYVIQIRYNFDPGSRLWRDRVAGCRGQTINYLLLIHKESQGLESFIQCQPLTKLFLKGHLDSIVWCKNRVVGAVVRYRRISVATPNLPRRQTSTLIFETMQESRMLSIVMSLLIVTMIVMNSWTISHKFIIHVFVFVVQSVSQCMTWAGMELSLVES